MSKSENKIQQLLFSYFWNYEPQTRRLILHFNNELEHIQGESKKSHNRRLSKAKSLGVVPGASDLVIFPPNKKPFFIELKIQGGVVSDAQTKFKEALEFAGYKVHQCWDYDHAFELIAEAFDIDLNSENVSLYSHYKKL